MKRRAFSLLLSLTLLLSLALPATTAYAEEDSSNKGMEISKTATANKDGSYTITLEAYATGAKVISDITKDVPTDIILVLDQSGSMSDEIGTVSFSQYEDEYDYWYGTTYHTRNQDYYEYRNNGGSGNLWYKLGDNSYVSVSVKRQEQLNYTELTNMANYSTSGWSQQVSTSCYWYYRDNNLYEKVGEEYVHVTLTRARSGRSYTYTYTFSDGTSVTSNGDNSRPNLGSHAPLYTATIDDTQTVYTYTYMDADGNVQNIGTSTGAETVFSPALYKQNVSDGGGTRLSAIKTAAATFVNAVAAKAAGADGDIKTTSDNINHRIAVVGFASESGYGNNTELLSISGWNSGDVGVAYNDITTQDYKDVVQDMDTASGQTMVNNAINALAANGATRIDLGMNMAKKILNANPVPAGEQRNRVVIAFTDGSPTDNNGFEKNVATSAITTSNEIKASGVTVYSIGVFSGADANSAGAEPSDDLAQGDSQMTAACNWFMQKVSSNNGTPQRPSYYLSASDSASLSNIFKQISDQIETGGSSSTLTSEAVVKDIISPQFTLPAGTTAANITVGTYACTGKDASGNYTWSNNNSTMGATASISGDQVNVTGFNFSENYVGTVTENGNTSYRGNKLVISFKVEPKAGFLGGNDVYTNTSAGIYENGSAENPLLTFDRPTVNVPIEDVTVTAQDKNVYLKGEVTADQLKDGATVKVGDVELDLSKATDADKPYGLDPWQTEYVNIKVEIKDAKGNVISDKLDNLTADTTSTVAVTVSPTDKGTSTAEKGAAATEKSGTSEKNIYVFKPELTFRDSTAYYGESVPANNNYSSNKVGTEKWKHDGTEAVPNEMLGEKPTLDISYTPDESKIKDGKYTKQDVPVSATVRIGTENVNEHTTFVHQDCTGKTCTLPEDYHFWIHIQTCTLSITKQDGAADESYVFDVYKDNVKYSEVTVWGNGTETLVELPIGTYTISENTGWSWRYSANNGGSAALTAQNPTGSITCVNTKNNNQWLNGFSEVVRNIFGTNH